MIDTKSHRISCPEYIEDLDKCIKIKKRQCQRQIHRVALDRPIPKKRKNFEGNIENFQALEFLEKNDKRSVG